jgi:SAM-dependent methyltransferase
MIAAGIVSCAWPPTQWMGVTSVEEGAAVCPACDVNTHDRRPPAGIEQTVTSCLVCSRELELFGPRAAYIYYRCRWCGTIQLSPMPDEAEILSAYRAEYAGGAQLQRYVDAEWARRVLKPYCVAVINALRDRKVDGVVIDCGVGWCGLLELMLGEGFEARGVELSEQQVAYARQRGLPVEEGDLSALQRVDKQASAVTFLAIFEHLVNHDRVLSDASRLLKDDGLLISLHPTAAFYRLFGTIMRLGNRHRELPSFAGAFAPPWHTTFLSIEATRQLFDRNGFRVLEIRPAPQGRLGGINGLMQIGLEYVNRIGWPLFGTRWPLVTSHIFICKKS